MAAIPLGSAVFSFEGLLPRLETPPIAARRALHHAGLHLLAEGWRSLSLDERQRLTLAGATDRVDTEQVRAVVRRSSPPAEEVPPGKDPEASTPPDLLARALAPSRVLDPARWASLRALDRYALAHAHLHAAGTTSSLLGEAFDVIVLPSASVLSPHLPTPLSTHLTEAGEVRMVDVGAKPKTERRAVASGSVRMKAETVERIDRRDAPKGEVLATARIAGIMAAKRTPELIPLCHGIALTRVNVDIEVDRAGSKVDVTATTEAFDRTGVEMEAMVAVSVACLTIYDMLKSVDREMVVSEIKLLEKSGGKSGHFQRNEGRS